MTGYEICGILHENVVSRSQTPAYTGEGLVYFHRETRSGSPPTSGGDKYVRTPQVFICKVKMDASCYLCSQNVDSGTWKKKRITLDRVGPDIEAVHTMNYILLCINPVNIPDVTYLCHKCSP